jgi:hypothetical protein
MSATRDPEQHTKFIFSNFYHLYLQSKAAQSVQPKSEALTGMVLRKGSITETPTPAKVHVVSSHASESVKNWVTTETQNGRASLVNQIQTLRDARKRLNFLMQEIDEILKRE